jgi:DNA-directed RNA polymerase specialized sigma24 family protein
MNTAIKRHTQLHVSSIPQTTQLQDDFDALVLRASQGDRRAIGAIAIAFGPTLLKEAKACLRGYEFEADDVLQDFFLSLLERRSLFAPARGRAIPWMSEAVRALARERNPDRAGKWGRGP